MPSTTSKPELVKKVWDILIHQQRPLTYRTLAEMLSSPGYRPIPQFMTQLLTPIMIYCDDHGLPRLNDLVVGQASGRPNYAPPGYNYRDSHRKIFAFDWSAITGCTRDFARL